VHVGPLRAQFIHHFAPLVRDVVIAGADRNFIGALIVPDLEACRAAAGIPTSADISEVASHPAVRDALRRRLESLSHLSTGSSNLVSRILLLTASLSMDAGELTDKGSINQRAVLRNRAEAVEQLYAGTPADHVICIDEP